MNKKAFEDIYNNYEKYKNIDFSKKYENVLKRICAKNKITPSGFFNAIQIISHTKFNMKYYN